MDFRFVGRYSITDIDFVSVDTLGAPIATDAPPVATLKNYVTNATIFARATTLVSATAAYIYRLTLSSVETATAGLWYMLFDYSLSAIPQEFRIDIEIPSNTSTIYDTLTDNYRGIVDGAWAMFEDMFDSILGGPHLQQYTQSKFGRERVAQLMTVALGKLNTFAQPHQSFGLAVPTQFPFTEWGPLLQQLTYIEVIRHLMRSYVEQPEAQNLNGAVRLDRRDYVTRWQAIYEMEMEAVKPAIDLFKQAAMNLGRSSILVSGGLFGNYPIRGNPAIRPRNMPGFLR